MKRVLVAFFLVSFLTGAATSTRVDDDERPILKISVQNLIDVKEKKCAIETVEILQGAVPAGAQAVLRMSLKGKTPLALDVFEGGFRERAARYCVGHVHVVQAVAADGATGYLEAVAIAWQWPGA